MVCFLPLEPKQKRHHTMKRIVHLHNNETGSHNWSARVSQTRPILYPLHACRSHGDVGISLQARRMQNHADDARAQL